MKELQDKIVEMFAKTTATQWIGDIAGLISAWLFLASWNPEGVNLYQFTLAMAPFGLVSFYWETKDAIKITQVVMMTLVGLTIVANWGFIGWVLLISYFIINGVMVALGILGLLFMAVFWIAGLKVDD